MPRATSITITNEGSQPHAKKLVELLKDRMKNSFLKPEIGAAPRGGSFQVFVTTGYEFQDEDGEPVADNEKALMDHMLMVLAFELMA